MRFSTAAIEALAARRAELTLLDVGTGGADIPGRATRTKGDRTAITGARRTREKRRVLDTMT